MDGKRLDCLDVEEYPDPGSWGSFEDPLAGTWVTIKSDRWIKRMALDKGMIEPFEERQFRTGVISYGL